MVDCRLKKNRNLRSCKRKSNSKKKDERRIKVNFNDLKSIKSSERMKSRLENQGYNLKKTSKVGFNKFVLLYKKNKK